MGGKLIKVKVIDRWRVVHEDKPYAKGDTLTVPESVGPEGESSGYVECVTKN